MTLQMVDKTLAHPVGILEDVLIKVGKFVFPVDFEIINIEEDKQVPLMLGRPFLATRATLIGVKKGELTLKVRDEAVHFDECLKHSSYTRVGSSFSHLFYNNFIVFVARTLILCLVWLEVHWSVKSSFWKQFWINEEQARK